MKLYIGCALTQAPEDFKKEIEEIKNKLRAKYEILDFIGVIEGTSEEVYMWDIHNCVEKCDTFIAFVDYPSLGLGYEMGTAIEKLSKPTLALAKTGALIGRLIVGINHPNFSFVRYENPEQVPQLIDDFLQKVNK